MLMRKMQYGIRFNAGDSLSYVAAGQPPDRIRIHHHRVRFVEHDDQMAASSS